MNIPNNSPVAFPLFELNDFLFFIRNHPLLFFFHYIYTFDLCQFMLRIIDEHSDAAKKTLSIEKVHSLSLFYFVISSVYATTRMDTIESINSEPCISISTNSPVSEYIQTR